MWGSDVDDVDVRVCRELGVGPVGFRRLRDTAFREKLGGASGGCRGRGGDDGVVDIGRIPVCWVDEEVFSER
jgi:hypothetical protein